MITGLNTKKNTYAFGMPMPGRNYQSSNSYRYGFNGKENDKETVGTGAGTQDYGFRIYNPALGKFLSIDPLTKSYPSWSPYPFAMNRPIDGVDLDGLEFLKKTDALIQFSAGYGGVALNVSNFNESQKKTWDKFNNETFNSEDNTLGASPLLIDVDITIPPPPPKAVNTKPFGPSKTQTQKNILPEPIVKTYLPKKIRERWVANGLPKYKNDGAANAEKISNGVTLLSNAEKLITYVGETYTDINWAIVIVTAERQSVFAKRTLVVIQDAIDRGFIKPENQSISDLYAISNYVLEGDAYGNKIAEGIAKEIIRIYGVPVQDMGTPICKPIPISVSTGGSIATPSAESKNDTNNGSYQNARFLD